MSAEKLTARAVFAAASLKVMRELMLLGAGIGHSVGATFEGISHSVLMVEQHYGRRYEDLTGVNLGGFTDESDVYRGGRETELVNVDEEDEEL